MDDFMLVLVAIAGGIISATIVICICNFACRYKTTGKVSNTSNSRTKSVSEPICSDISRRSLDLGSTEVNEGDVSPCLSCRRPSTFSNSCECEISAQPDDRKPLQVQFSLFYNFHTSHLFINIMCGLNVPRRWYGKCPPTQVRFQLLPDDSNVYRTEIKSNTGEPIFNETFEFIGYSENELRELILRLGLYAFDKFSRGKMIGYTDVHFSREKFQPSEPTIIWRELLPKSQSRERSLSLLTRGEIHISLRYEANRARLNVTILKATNLPKTSKFRNTAPYVCVILNANGVVLESRQTKKSRGINAVWNQGFLFDVESETIDEYSITIKVMNYDLLTNDEIIGEMTLGPESEGSGREHWEEAMRKKHTRREVAMTHKLE